jgi:hypothetical protein
MFLTFLCSRHKSAAAPGWSGVPMPPFSAKENGLFYFFISFFHFSLFVGRANSAVFQMKMACSALASDQTQ